MTNYRKASARQKIKIEMEEGAHYAFIEQFQKQAKFKEARITTIDGVRADFSGRLGPGAMLQYHALPGIAI